MSDVNLIRDRFKEAGVQLGGRDTWKVQSATVIKHSALERLAAACGITFEAPTIVRAEADEAVVLVTGRMRVSREVEEVYTDKEGQTRAFPDKALRQTMLSEWSFGEAKIGLNYRVSGNQAGYPWAMAEKRAKDRVIIKLVGLHGVYSSEEADDFREGGAPAREADRARQSNTNVRQSAGKEGNAYLNEDEQDARQADGVRDAFGLPPIAEPTAEQLRNFNKVKGDFEAAGSEESLKALGTSHKPTIETLTKAQQAVLSGTYTECLRALRGRKAA